MTWDDLEYWRSGEWQVVEERLDDLDKSRTSYNPRRELLFAALDAVPFEDVRVAIVGQDPYPNVDHATGIAFDIPDSVKVFPPTLNIIFEEYENDLHLPRPSKGTLVPWCNQGVLLWNAIPSCLSGRSMSHNWVEWTYLTKEIIERLTERGIVFAFLGGVARDYTRYVNTEKSYVIETSHPSPRGNLISKHPFAGSRIFSTINAHLADSGFPPVDWRL